MVFTIYVYWDLKINFAEHWVRKAAKKVLSSGQSTRAFRAPLGLVVKKPATNHKNITFSLVDNPYPPPLLVACPLKCLYILQ